MKFMISILYLLSQLVFVFPHIKDGSVRPNIVVLLADDLGIGDLGCYGNSTTKTDNIDRLCKEGVKFTHHLSTAALCTPSRAAFMTGRYAIRMGLENQSDDHPGVVMYVSGKAGLPENETTWADILKDKGYNTAAIGKWHLGWDDTWKGDQKHGPLGHGFNSFFGLPFTLVDGFELDLSFFTYSAFYDKKAKDHPMHNNSLALILSLVAVCAVYSKEFGYLILVLLIIFFLAAWFFMEHFSLHKEEWWRRSLYMEKFLNSVLMNDRRVFQQPIQLETLNEKVTERAVNFIEESSRNQDQPFALYLAFPNVHTPLVPSKRSKGKSNHGAYGDSLLDLDASVGKVLKALDDAKVADNTLVYFASDHGSHIDLGAQGGSNRPFTGGKGMGAIEGGIRVPAIMRWPGVIKPGNKIDTPTSLMDFFPTILDLVQGDPELHQKIDGKSYLDFIKGSSAVKTKEDRIIRHYCGANLHALRLVATDGNVYKANFRRPKLNDQGHCGYATVCPCFGDEIQEFRNPQLIDIINDPQELNPIQENDPRYKSIVPKLKSYFKSAENEWKPESQYARAWNVMPRPWIQPCANFPLCRTSG